ncbi:PREDICTED: growth-regulating factor 9-like isoform X2 [Camelina sativa]|uniref:Growth-regulating factor n=1 Tax=Camelina sativa TaxID=90675 RepID=A0ABM0ZNA6_CAMSA|nr:PREDICTED: growth-regulating factor 9-like isoform X2 [Camelina sativa]
MQSPKMEQDEELEERRRKKWPWMKAAQFVEFQMQTLVYRYIEAGLRVPHHLVVSIWNSLALSSSSNYNSPSSSLLSSDKGLNHIHTVEPEPTRCRRTDGKKWRCSNRVLLYEKYCERHMHRGRKRSRKLVESSYKVASSSASLTKHDNTYGLDINNDSESVLLHETMSGSSNAQVVTIASLPSARACDNVIRPSLVISESTKESVSHGDRSRRNMEMSYDDLISKKESSMCVSVVPLQGDESLPSVQKFFPEVSDSSLQGAQFSGNRKNEIIARSREWKNMNVVNGGLFHSIHFSQDTVLQDRGGFRLQRVETDKEPGRCRRTDGKRWRCSKDVLSGQKYCDKHMHRGIKKKHPVDTTIAHENAGYSPLTVKTAARSVTCKDGDDQKLSLLVMGIPLPRVSDEKTTSSCSTDTTITDIALRGEEDNEEILSLFSSGV